MPKIRQLILDTEKGILILSTNTKGFDVACNYRTLLAIVSFGAGFSGAMAQDSSVDIVIDEYTPSDVVGVTNGNSVDKIDITVNGTGRTDIIGGHLAAVNGGTVGEPNYNAAIDSLYDSGFNAVSVTLNGGNIKQALRSNASNVSSVIYGNVVYNINAGSVGIGSGYSGDPMYVMGTGYYGQKGSSTNEVYGNVAVNIGRAGGSVSDVFIGYNDANNPNGFVVGAGTGTVRGDVSINMQSGGAGYLFGASYGSVVGGNTYVTVGKGAQVTYYVLAGGSNINDNFSSDIAGSTNVLIQGNVGTHVYGGHYSGGTRGTIGGNVNVTVDGGSVGGTIYGGVGNIAGDVNIVLKDASVGGSIYAGSESSRGGAVAGNVNVSISGVSSVVGTIYSGSASGSKNLSVESYAGADSLRISDFDVVSVSDSTVSFETSFHSSLLSVSEGADVSLASGTSFDSLKLLFIQTDVSTGSEVQLDSFFSDDSSSIVLSAISGGDTEVSLFDSDGQQWDIVYEDGILTVGAAVPEPSAYAAIFGVLALVLAVYRRRR